MSGAEREVDDSPQQEEVWGCELGRPVEDDDSQVGRLGKLVEADDSEV